MTFPKFPGTRPDHFAIRTCGCLAVAICFASLPTRATTITTVVQDGFDDGDRLDGADPLDANWFVRTLTGTTLSVIDDDVPGGHMSGNALDFQNANNYDVTVVPVPEGFSVGTTIGDQVVLEFDTRITFAGPVDHINIRSRTRRTCWWELS